MQTDEITIQGHTFTVPLRYSAGHPLTENEASALNQTYHENLRNNFAKTVKDKLVEVFGEGGEGELSEDQLAELQSKMDEYAQAYEFGARRSGGGRAPADPIEREALNIAKAAIRGALKLKNKKAEPDQIAEMAKALVAQDGKYRELAARRLEEQKAIASDSMDSILSGVAA